MIKSLVKNGNSLALVINKDMLSHMGVEGSEVEILETPRGYVIQRPLNRLSFDEALDRTLNKYHEALTELAK